MVSFIHRSGQRQLPGADDYSGGIGRIILFQEYLVEDQILFYTLKTESFNQEERIMPTYQQHPSSFRDPSGFVFEEAGKLYRQVNSSYAGDYDLLMRSGLYALLSEKNWLIPHTETELSTSEAENRYKIILPQYIPFISYPYEWCFEQLQDAALLTLEIMKAAIDHGMVLKDANPYNIQFLSGKPVHIDTLSFEIYDEHHPWIAYRQFCECFLYPLLAAKYTSMEVHRIFAAYPEGIPAKIVSGLLPAKARLKLGNWLHVFLPASVSQGNQQKKISFSRTKLLSIIEHLQNIIQSLRPSAKNDSIWDRYYEEEILSRDYLASKEKIVSDLVKQEEYTSIMDLGCNQGLFSNIVAGKGSIIVAVDANANSISHLYIDSRSKGLNILPLCIDLANPPGNGGFSNRERKAFHERMQFQLCLALAIVHHLCIGKNVPFDHLAEFLSSFSNCLVIEFVSKEDEKVQQLLRGRKDIFPHYNRQHFENAFQKFFRVMESTEVPGSTRRIYKMKKN